MIAQVLDPGLASEIGVVGWCLMAFVISGVAGAGWFLRRMAQAMDRMASAQEAASPAIGTLAQKLEDIDERLESLERIALRDLEISETWLKTEAPGRIVKGG